MDEDRADVAEAALAHAAAAEAAVMAIVLEMREYLPDFPERVSRRLADDLALRWLAIGSPEAGRNAAAIERLAKRLGDFAPPRQSTRLPRVDGESPT